MDILSKQFNEDNHVQAKAQKLEFIPDRLYQVGLFFVQHYLKTWNARSIDGNRLDVPDLAALIIDHFPCLPA
jgi:hypothetical protein